MIRTWPRRILASLAVIALGFVLYRTCCVTVRGPSLRAHESNRIKNVILAMHVFPSVGRRLPWTEERMPDGRC